MAPSASSPSITEESRVVTTTKLLHRFVTATGTDVGKTFVTAGLVRALVRQGEGANAIKPVLSGFDEDNSEGWPQSDPGVLLQALGKPVTRESIAGISPFHFRAPLSPDMAASREGKTLSFDSVVAFCRQQLQQARGPLLVEGVGGALVPLDDEHTVAEWANALGLDTIVVTRGALGMLSHTLTAVESLVARGVNVSAVVINQGVDAPEIRLDAGDAPTTDETVAVLSRHLRRGAPSAPTVVVLPSAPSNADFESLARALGLLL